MLARNIRYAFRAMRQNPGFTATAILTLAACLGTNTAVFAILYSVLLRPLPVPDADRLVHISNRYPNAGAGDSNNRAIGDYYDSRRELTTLADQALYRPESQTVEIAGTPERIPGMVVTPTLFKVIQTEAAAGRTFTDDEGEIGNERKVVLSDGLAQQLFGAPANAVGKQVRLGGREHSVVGVMPPGFLFMDPDVRLWIPTAFSPDEKTAYHSNNHFHIGRMKPGVTIAQVQAQVDALNRANLDRFPQYREILINAGFHSSVEPLSDMLTRKIAGTLSLLWGGALLVVLIGVVNLANLSLARLQTRMKELATRLAIGAGRGQLAGQLLTENTLLALLGGIAGLWVGYATLQALPLLGLDELPRASEIRIDAAVAAVSIGVAVAVGLLLALIALAHVMAINVNEVLHENSRTGSGGTRARMFRQSMVVSQVALAFVLLIASGLLLTSFRNLLNEDPGFRTARLATASTVLPSARYADDNARRIFVHRLLQEVRAIPGITAAGTTNTLPLSGQSNDSVILPEAYEYKPGESLISPKFLTVSPGYFEAVQIPLVTGRTFEDRDNETAEPVIIIDQQLARRFWGDQNPLGKRLRFPDSIDNIMELTPKTRWMRVVGVVRTARLWDLAQQGSAVGVYYVPYAQNPGRGLSLAIATSVDPSAVNAAVRSTIQSLDSELALFDVRTMEERLQLSVTTRRTAMSVALIFGALALFLSALGIYGVLAYFVANRAHEIGIRMAIGSTQADVFRLILKEGVVLVAIGLTAGLVGSFALRDAVATQLYGVGAVHFPVVVAATAILAAVALAACAIPARRASKTDPARVLTQA